MTSPYLRYYRPWKIQSLLTYSTIYTILPAGKQHSSDFSRLIAQVRGRLETSRPTRIKQDVIVEGKDAPKTHCAGTTALINFLKE